MTDILIAFTLGYIACSLFGRWAMWMNRRVWDSDPTEAALKFRQRFLAKMTHESLTRFKAALEAELARRQP